MPSALLFLPLVLLLQSAPSDQATPAVPAAAYEITRIDEDDLKAFVVKVRLTDPRVTVSVVPAHPQDPDGEGPCVTTLRPVSQVARERDFEIAVNASFFAAPAVRPFNGKNIRYFAGNPGHPVGWLVHEGHVLTKPARENMPTLIVRTDGSVGIEPSLTEMPEAVRFAVSGNVMLLDAGQPVEHANDTARHPRTALGLSQDKTTLILLVVDGRREGWSRGCTYGELASKLIEHGAYVGMNLDGGGSSTLVIKDPATGVHAIANRPSDRSPAYDWMSIERAVTDVIGIDIAE
jgi:exopolysaccharide biosynthesis protein